ncbi:MAG: chorismate synthase [Dysosmobacter sp.]
MLWQNSWLKLQDIKVNAQVIDENALRQRAEEARQEGDSVGGQVRCIVTGLPAGWGGPDWRETAESEIARHVFAIPGVKAVAFGAGEELAALRGSQANDPWRTDGRRSGLSPITAAASTAASPTGCRWSSP